MILYHFTGFYNLENVGPENIMAVGLKATPLDHQGENGWYVLGGLRGVWLTANPDMPKNCCGHHEARLKLVIPSSDRKLVHLPKLLRKRLGADEMKAVAASLNASGAMNEWRHFYLYLDDVPLDYLRAVEYADADMRAEIKQKLADGEEVELYQAAA